MPISLIDFRPKRFDVGLKCPEERLWISVLLQGYKDLCAPEVDIRESAQWWFFNDDSGIHELCWCLGVDVSVARKSAIYLSQNRQDRRIRNALHKGDLCFNFHLMAGAERSDHRRQRSSYPSFS